MNKKPVKLKIVLFEGTPPKLQRILYDGLCDGMEPVRKDVCVIPDRGGVSRGNSFDSDFIYEVMSRLVEEGLSEGIGDKIYDALLSYHTDDELKRYGGNKNGRKETK